MKFDRRRIKEAESKRDGVNSGQLIMIMMKGIKT
jgi:hypothetical protein